jgi:hypothetical protein
MDKVEHSSAEDKQVTDNQVLAEETPSIVVHIRIYFFSKEPSINSTIRKLERYIND